MKRKVLISEIAVAALAFCVLGLCACDDNRRDVAVPAKPVSMLAPYAVSLGDFLYWDKVDGADGYSVYLDGERIASIADNRFQFVGAGEYSVVAENSVSQTQSKNSDIVAVYDYESTSDNTLYFSTDEWFPTDRDYTVSSKIDKVVVTCDVPIAFVIGERTRDLIFEMNGVTIGGIRTTDGSYSRFKHNYSVILEIKDTCVIKGGDGASGASYGGVSFNDSELGGLRGEDGYDAVSVPSLIIRGSGSLSIAGGNGGRGGNGANATEWSGKHSGMGGSGGNGGAGVKTSFFVLEFDGDGVVTVKNGNGGIKGRRGDNADIGTGFDEWFFGTHDGVDGVSGESRFGCEIIVNGTVNKK